MDSARVYPLLEPPTACAGCGDSRVRPLHVFPVNHNKPRVTRQLNLALIGCERCGSVFSYPFPTDEDLAAYYGTPAGWDDRIPEGDAVAAKKLRRLREKHAADLELVKSLIDLPDLRPGVKRRALDFGCGIGGWLGALKQDGWETFGIEPGPRAAAIAAREHDLLARPPADGSLDLVVLHHTLEHLRDPGDALASLVASLRPGGGIWISVPNFELLGRHRDFVYVAGDKHVFSFTSSSLRSLLALAGAEAVADSNEDGWRPAAGKSRKDKRLICVARRTEALVPLPPDPLAPALRALAAYGEAEQEPEPASAPGRLRRLLRKVLR